MLRRKLTQGVRKLSLPWSESQSEQCLQYLQLLVKWNAVYNLTAIRDPADMVSKHLLDSLSIQPYLHGARILDVGTGAGLPGIPLAIAEPTKHFTLLDANQKKIRFVQQAVIELGLTNVDACAARIEAFRPAQPFTCITTRAFAQLADMQVIGAHLLAEKGQLLAMKGALSQEEITPPTGYAISTIQPLQVPSLDALRNVVILNHTATQ